MQKLRETLNDSARHPRYVETVPRRGYRWVGPPPASLEAEESIPARRSVLALRYLASAVFVLALAGGGMWLSAVNEAPRTPPEQPLKAVPLTSYEGSEVSPTFSPDGNQVAFSWNGESRENFDIYVQVAGSGSPRRITSDPADDVAPAWSPDGRHIAFVRAIDRSPVGQGALYLISPLGGTERRLEEGSFVWCPDPTLVKLGWSSDAGELFFVAWDEGKQSIHGIDIESGVKHRVTSPPLDAFGDYSLAVSPDGKSLAFARLSKGLSSEVYVAAVNGGDPRRIASPTYRTDLAWTPDGQDIVFVSWSSARFGPSLWRIEAAGGSPRPLAVLGGGGTMPVVSPTGHRLVYERRVDNANIWRYDRPKRPGAAWLRRRLISSTLIDGTPQIAPDGERIAFVSQRSGSFQIWMAASDGTNQVQLTSLEGNLGTPRWSPDGHRIVFDYRIEGIHDRDIYVVDAMAGTSRRIVAAKGTQGRPSWSHDGKWIYFVSDETGSDEIWKAPAAGGSPVQLTLEGGWHPFESPDGQFVYYADGSVWSTLKRVPTGGGEEVAVITGFQGAHAGWWDVTDDGIYYIDEEATPLPTSSWTLKFFDLKTKEVIVVSRLDQPPSGHTAIEVSPDGDWFLYVQQDRSESDLMLVEGFE